MRNLTSIHASHRMILLRGTASLAAAILATSAHAQSDNYMDGGIQDIVVTAQKREQNLQDVPIAITAVTAAALEANRVTSVQDLSGLAPNFTVRPASGGVGLPTFSMRGITSFGVVPGSDKQISIYVDGVYLGSPRGSAFELPDIERIEVLRGPQGTLFGRNATAGAVSIVTRQPTGTLGFRQDVSVGSHSLMRTRTTVDLPAVGPFSAYVTYVHEERDGDVRNVQSGMLWDRTGPFTKVGVQRSAKTLGSKDADNWFAAVRFEPSDTFNMTYKFDRSTNNFSPEAQALVAINPNTPLLGALVQSLIPSDHFTGKATRPDAVYGGFTTEAYQRTSGHNLTANLELSDTVSLKNIASYRKTFINSASALDGAGVLTLTADAVAPFATLAAFSQVPNLATNPNAASIIASYAAGLVPMIGNRFCLVCNNSQAGGEQYSNELQVNVDTDFMTLTVGGLYFHQKDYSGGPIGMANNFAFTPLDNSGRLPLGNESTTYTKGTSIAAYAQGEFHITDTLDVIAGARITKDKKSGEYVYGGVFTPGPNGFEDGTYSGLQNMVFSYKKTKPTFSLGLNYKPTNDLLFYGKYSTAFVSGGSVGPVTYEPETVEAFELGAKADLFDRMVRTNLALFHATYKHQQSAQSGSNVGYPQLATVIIDAGQTTAKGVEFEATVAPARGLTFSGGLGYTDINLDTVNPVMIRSGGGNRIVPVLIPKWTGSLSGQYDSPELFAGAHLMLRVDATYQGKRRNNPNPDPTPTPSFNIMDVTPAYWVVNGRVALKEVTSGPGQVEVAAWVKNLFNDDTAMFPLILQNTIKSSSFIPARSYGLDVTFRF